MQAVSKSKIKQLLISFLAFLTITALAFTAKAQERQKREVGRFNSVSVGGVINLYLQQGSQESVVVEASSDLMEKVVTEVSSNTLKLYTKKTNWGWGSKEKINVYVTCEDIEGISASGASDVYVETALRGDKLRFSGSGSCDFSIPKTLYFNEMEIGLSGSSDAKISDVQAQDIRCSLSGSCDLKMGGEAQNIEIRSSGACDVKAIDLRVASCRADASGASDISIHVTETLNANLSGASDLKYRGSPRINSLKTSGSASISSDSD